MLINDAIFSSIKEKTSGYLDAAIYKEMYQISCNLMDEIIVDIGPAQGASTICFALAAKKSKHIKSIISIDMFKNSEALRYKNSVENNKMVLEDNLSYYKCGEKVELYEANDVKKAKEKLTVQKIGLIFIDADGNIDRDLLFWHKYFSDNCILIIDDVSNVLNTHAKNVYLKVQSYEQLQKLIARKGIADIIDYPILGKQYTTWALVAYLIKNKYIVIEKFKNETLFAHMGTRVWNEEIMKKEMREIRKKIYAKYVTINKYLVNIYGKIEKPLKEIVSVFQCNFAVVYEYYDYDIKRRQQASKVYSYGIENDTGAELQVLSSRDLSIVETYFEGGFKDYNSYPESKIEKYLNKDVSFVQLTAEERRIGFIMLGTKKRIDCNIIRNNLEKIVDIIEIAHEKLEDVCNNEFGNVMGL